MTTKIYAVVFSTAWEGSDIESPFTKNRETAELWLAELGVENNNDAWYGVEEFILLDE